MERGIPSDYKLKEVLINQEKAELDEVIKILHRLSAAKEQIAPKIKHIQSESEQSLDSELLQTLITEVMELLEELEKSDHSAQ